MKVTGSTRLALPQVTLVAVTSVNIAATIAALRASMANLSFGAVKLLTDRDLGQPLHGIQVVAIPNIGSAREYSEFILRELPCYIATSHALIVQWDGHVLDARRWKFEFLDYDYIGASWPQFADGHDVGNGGFSLRSRRLMEACRDPAFRASHPEDVAIGRINRAMLEDRGMRFAERALADAFSAERAGDPLASFGYHGVWHMPRLLGRDEFWRIYSSLDERSTARHDFHRLFSQLAWGRGGLGCALGLIRDQICKSA